MKSFRLKAIVLCCALVGANLVSAQSSFVLTNGNSGTESVFTNSLGTATVVDGLIVFEGQLDSDIIVAKAVNPTTGLPVAALQLLVQIKLFDELPASNEVGQVQGAVAVLRDAPESTTGTVFAWGSTNNVMEWVPLYQSDGMTPFSLADGSTNYITFIFNYAGVTNVPQTNVTYQVFIGDTAWTQTASDPVTTLTVETDGINGVSLLGTGALESFASASGSVGPLSSEIGFSVYATSQGVLFVLDPVNEQEVVGKYFIVKAFINGEWVEVGKVLATGAGHYEFYAYPGMLQVGQSYAFMVIDEMDNPHTLPAVEIKTIKMDSVIMTPEYMTVTFNSEAQHQYQVISAESLTAETWTATAIYYPMSGGGWGYGSDPFTAAESSTTIRIPRSTTKGFFKIRKVN